jgi:hypothetical protein
VLINSAGSIVKTLVTTLGETFTHEMISQGPGTASQSELSAPTPVNSCNYPIDVNSLRFGFPGMEKSLNVGAIYADIYGSGAIRFDQGGNTNVVWQLGDTARANAIADALDAVASVDVAVEGGQYTVHRILRNGAPSPYGLHQFYDIEGTNLGTSGQSTDNISISSTFCSWAYALGGPPMTAYDYGNGETSAAANALANYTYNQCIGNLPWVFKNLPLTIFTGFFGCDSGTICAHAVNMVLNCTVLGGASCGSNTPDYQYALAPNTSHARTISPDRLGGLTRFMNEIPRPTTWATDTPHSLTWNGAGRYCGCYE